MVKVVTLDLADLEKVQGGATIRAGATPQEAETLRRQARLGQPVDALGHPLTDLLDPLHQNALRPPVTTIPRPTLNNNATRAALDALNRATAGHAQNTGGNRGNNGGNNSGNNSGNNGGNHGGGNRSHSTNGGAHNTSHDTSTDNDNGGRSHTSSRNNSGSSHNTSSNSDSDTSTSVPLPRSDPRKTDVPLPRPDPRGTPDEQKQAAELKKFEDQDIINRTNGLPGAFGDPPFGDPSKARSEVAASAAGHVAGDDRFKTQEQINREALAGFGDAANANYMDIMQGKYVAPTTTAEALAQGQMIAREEMMRPGGLSADPDYALGLYLTQHQDEKAWQDGVDRALGENVGSVLDQDRAANLPIDPYTYGPDDASAYNHLSLDDAIKLDPSINELKEKLGTPTRDPSYVDPNQGLPQVIGDSSFDTQQNAGPAAPLEQAPVLADVAAQPAVTDAVPQAVVADVAPAAQQQLDQPVTDSMLT